ncbi:hypothetical protein [Sulfurimonas sp.]|uniref:hypothetical protein n=1 Tax=Sulfurimonas sp. TaxID=2022749 RepID=UPI002B479C31|nr:hypothetical protein [Sulfurimonas sp.]
MEKIKLKYAPMIIVIYFSVMGLAIALLISVLKYFMEGSSIIKILEAPLSISIIVTLIGLVYCEVSSWIKNLWIGSIIFGILSSNLFIFSLPISSLVFNGEIGALAPLNLYLALTLLGSPLLGSIYFTIKRSKLF